MKTRLVKLLRGVKNDIIGDSKYISIADRGHIAIIDEIIYSSNSLDYNVNLKTILKYTNDRVRLNHINKEIKQIYESVHNEYLYKNKNDISDKDMWYHNHYYRYFIDEILSNTPDRIHIMDKIRSLYNVFEEDPFDDWEYVNSFMVQLSDNIREKLKDKDKKDSVKLLLEDFKKDNTMLTDCMFTKDFIFGDDGKKYDILKETFTNMSKMVATICYGGKLTNDVERSCKMLGEMFASNIVYPRPKLDDILKNPMYHKDYTIK